MKRPVEERLADVEQRLNRLKQKEKLLRAEQSRKARNARTKRLVEIGAVTEKALGIELDTREKRECYLRLLLEVPTGQTRSRGEILAKEVRLGTESAPTD